MALPSLVKTWSYSLNMGPYTSLSAVEYAWKTQMVTLGAVPWAVLLSSNAVTANASDNWGGAGSVVHNDPGSAHSWIVLKQTGIASNFQICFDCLKNGGGNQTVTNAFVSASAGFTGGTIQNRPTATDEISLQAGMSVSSQWTNAENLGLTPARLNVWTSSDGQCTRWSIWLNNFQTCFFLIDKIRNPVSGLTVPWVHSYGGATDYGLAGTTYAQLNAQNTRTYVGLGSTYGRTYLTSEAYGTSPYMIGQAMTFGGDLDSGAYPLLPIGLYCTTASLRGRLGELFDIWWGSTTPNDGDHYPADGSRQFVQLNDIVLPWNGGTALIRA